MIHYFGSSHTKAFTILWCEGYSPSGARLLLACLARVRGGLIPCAAMPVFVSCLILLHLLLQDSKTMKYFSPEEWRRIWISYRDSPEQQTGIEILRQHLQEDTRIDSNLLTSESTWYMHFKRSPNPYLR